MALILFRILLRLVFLSNLSLQLFKFTDAFPCHIFFSIWDKTVILMFSDLILILISCSSCWCNPKANITTLLWANSLIHDLVWPALRYVLFRGLVSSWFVCKVWCLNIGPLVFISVYTSIATKSFWLSKRFCDRNNIIILWLKMWTLIILFVLFEHGLCLFFLLLFLL